MGKEGLETKVLFFSSALLPSQQSVRIEQDSYHFGVYLCIFEEDSEWSASPIPQWDRRCLLNALSDGVDASKEGGF